MLPGAGPRYSALPFTATVATAVPSLAAGTNAHHASLSRTSEAGPTSGPPPEQQVGQPPPKNGQVSSALPVCVCVCVCVCVEGGGMGVSYASRCMIEW